MVLSEFKNKTHFKESLESQSVFGALASPPWPYKSLTLQRQTTSYPAPAMCNEHQPVTFHTNIQLSFAGYFVSDLKINSYAKVFPSPIIVCNITVSMINSEKYIVTCQ